MRRSSSGRDPSRKSRQKSTSCWQLINACPQIVVVAAELPANIAHGFGVRTRAPRKCCASPAPILTPPLHSPKTPSMHPGPIRPFSLEGLPRLPRTAARSTRALARAGLPPEIHVGLERLGNLRLSLSRVTFVVPADEGGSSFA